MMKAFLRQISSYILKEVYHEFIKESLGHIERLKRVERAYEILTQRGDYNITCIKTKPLTFKVEGPNETYTVIEAGNDKICTCPDNEPICKHRFAVKIILESLKAMKVPTKAWEAKG
jgi:hypothetical protein